MVSDRFDIYTSRCITRCDRGVILLGMSGTILVISFRIKYMALERAKMCTWGLTARVSVSPDQADLSILIFKMGLG